MLSAEIIAIGSELLTPEKTDTNSLWLTEKLNEIGVEVKLKTIVGDDAMRLEETIRDAVKRSEIVITTGGLGPTEDDLTREISARAIGRELVYHKNSNGFARAFQKMGTRNAGNQQAPGIRHRRRAHFAESERLGGRNVSRV
jgi:nicotinamide-nucleotide amidase